LKHSTHAPQPSQATRESPENPQFTQPSIFSPKLIPSNSSPQSGDELEKKKMLFWASSEKETEDPAETRFQLVTTLTSHIVTQITNQIQTNPLDGNIAYLREEYRKYATELTTEQVLENKNVIIRSVHQTLMQEYARQEAMRKDRIEFLKKWFDELTLPSPPNPSRSDGLGE
jgi:hypothetical protein